MTPVFHIIHVIAATPVTRPPQDQVCVNNKAESSANIGWNITCLNLFQWEALNIALDILPGILQFKCHDQIQHDTKVQIIKLETVRPTDLSD